MKTTDKYTEWLALESIQNKVRTVIRNATVGALSLGCKIDNTTEWIRFPYYHHVFEDELKGFENQLRFLRNFGEFISIDDAIIMIDSEDSIDGRYFCISFDDGLKCCLINAAEVLSKFEIPATFYIVTSLIGKSLDPDDVISREKFGFKGRDTTLDFLSWDDCRNLSKYQITIGSHTKNHNRLSELEETQLIEELRDSKTKIEVELEKECKHLCVPYGIPGRDFDKVIVRNNAISLGYSSLVTGIRGPSINGSDVYAIRRDQLLASWGNSQLRYFLS